MSDTPLTHSDNQEPTAFTQAQLEWLPWLPPLPEDELTDRHCAGLVDAARANSPYFRLLARDPDTLGARTPEEAARREMEEESGYTVTALEKIGVIESLKRSRELVNGNGWRVFGFGACLAIITLAVLLISLIIVIPFGTGMAGLLVSNFVAVCVSYPLLLTGPAALYNELVERQPEPVPETL